MKKLWILTAATIFLVAASGCECTRSWCSRRAVCSPCPPVAAPACNSCGMAPAYQDSYLAPPSVDVAPGPVTN